MSISHLQKQGKQNHHQTNQETCFYQFSPLLSSLSIVLCNVLSVPVLFFSWNSEVGFLAVQSPDVSVRTVSILGHGVANLANCDGHRGTGTFHIRWQKSRVECDGVS